MKGICNPEEIIEEFQDGCVTLLCLQVSTHQLTRKRDLDVSPERQKFVKKFIGNWNFTAHDFSEDELVFGACEMLQHAFTLPNLDQWRLTPCK